MFDSLRLKMGVLAAGLSCLLAGSAAAQQQFTPGQPGRPGDPERSTIQQQQQRPGETGRQMAGGQSQEVERFLASCLLAKNQAQVQISQIAQREAQDQQVKQFAEKMVEEHRELSQRLQQVAGAQGAARQPGQPFGTTSQYDAQRQPGDTTRPAGSPGLTPGTPGTDAADPTQGAIAQARAGDSGAINQLIQIERQIVERSSQQLREKLDEKSGAEFDKCYLAAQLASHMHMAAALEVIEQQTSGQLKQIAGDAKQSVEEHLQKAEQLMERRAEGRQAGATRDPAVRPASAR